MSERRVRAIAGEGEGVDTTWEWAPVWRWCDVGAASMGVGVGTVSTVTGAVVT